MSEEQWKELTRQIREHQEEISDLAARRAQITRELYARPGMTDRELGKRLGVSGAMICMIRHHGEIKPGRKIPEALAGNNFPE